jgi:hypothetical protein
MLYPCARHSSHVQARFVPPPPPGLQPYLRIAAFTSNIPEAGTDARVYVDVFGSRGQLLDLYMRDTGDTFNEVQRCLAASVAL